MILAAINFERIRKLSTVDRDEVSLEDKGFKLIEEIGEVSSAYLAYKGSKNVSASSEAVDTKEALMEELNDVINVVYDLILYDDKDTIVTEEDPEVYPKEVDYALYLMISEASREFDFIMRAHVLTFYALNNILNRCYSIMVELGYSDNEILAMCNKKLDKWEAKQQKYK